MKATLLKTLKQLRRRYSRQLFLRVQVWSLTALAGLGLLVDLAEHFGLSSLTVTAGVALPAVLLSMAVSCAYTCWRTPGLPAIARLADHHYGLGERLSSSLEAEAAPPADPLLQAVLGALHADAAAAAAALRPASFASLKLPLLPGWILSMTLLAFILLQLQSPAALRSADSTEKEAAASTDSVAEQELFAELLNELLDMSPDAQAGVADQPLGQASDQNAGTAPSAAQQSITQATPSAIEADADAASSSAQQLRPSGPDAGQGKPAAAATPVSSGQGRSDPLAERRNDGSVNPAFDQAGARDQELREQGRRMQERATSPGGAGDQAALADSSVAGDATAGFEPGAASPLPERAPAGTELELPSRVNPESGRIIVELPPEADKVRTGSRSAATVSWGSSEAPAVTGRELARAADREFLQRYHSQVLGQETNGTP